MGLGWVGRWVLYLGEFVAKICSVQMFVLLSGCYGVKGQLIRLPSFCQCCLFCAQALIILPFVNAFTEMVPLEKALGAGWGGGSWGKHFSFCGAVLGLFWAIAVY